MSLVASYTDSEGEEDLNQSEILEKIPLEESKMQSLEPLKTVKSGLNLLGGRQDLDEDNSTDSSDQDSDGAEDVQGLQGRRKKLSDTPLDNPFRFFGSGNVSAQDSVLRVEFREQEAKKTAVLERHVKMTETAGVAMIINGKKICWNHRKGKCRFGHNCKFAHDSDILNSDGVPSHPEKLFSPMSSVEEALRTSEPLFPRKVPVPARVSEETDNDLPTTPVFFASSAHLSGGSGNSGKRKKSDDFSDEEGDDSKKSGKDKRKKRPGLTPGLVPGKKAMNMYYKTKDS